MTRMDLQVKTRWSLGVQLLSPAEGDKPNGASLQPRTAGPYARMAGIARTRVPEGQRSTTIMRSEDTPQQTRACVHAPNAFTLLSIMLRPDPRMLTQPGTEGPGTSACSGSGDLPPPGDTVEWCVSTAVDIAS